MQRTSAHIRFSTRTLSAPVGPNVEEKKAPETEPESVDDIESGPAGVVPEAKNNINQVQTRLTSGPGVGAHNMSAMNRAFFSDYR